MKKFKLLLMMAILIGIVAIAYAGFDDGKAAYDRGDYATAYKEFKELAAQGNVPAQCYLGMMYEMGHDVPQDYALAMDWYLKAAAQGDPLAKVNLGWLYIRGDGVPQNYVLAHMWLNLAASQGYTPAQRYRNDLANKMTPAQIADAQHLASEWKPKGKTDAQGETDTGRWIFLKRLPKLDLYVESKYVDHQGQYVKVHQDQDHYITVLEDYFDSSIPTGAKSSECHYRVDIQNGIYMGIGGFDYPEHMGKGKAMHFEFIPSTRDLEDTLNNKSKWWKASPDNVGGPMINFIKNRLSAGGHQSVEQPAQDKQ